MDPLLLKISCFAVRKAWGFLQLGPESLHTRCFLWRSELPLGILSPHFIPEGKRQESSLRQRIAFCSVVFGILFPKCLGTAFNSEALSILRQPVPNTHPTHGPWLPLFLCPTADCPYSFPRGCQLTLASWQDQTLLHRMSSPGLTKRP